ncbi:MAG: molecular chaperone GrpE [Myxococcota bacterium]|jgi:molecular chaperone GrpE
MSQRDATSTSPEPEGGSPKSEGEAPEIPKPAEAGAGETSTVDADADVDPDPDPDADAQAEEVEPATGTAPSVESEEEEEEATGATAGSAEEGDSAADEEDAPPVIELVPPAPEPTLEELRADLALARAQLADSESARASQAKDLDAAQGRLRAVSKAFRDLQAEMDAFRKRQEVQGKLKAERQSFAVVRAFLDPVQNLKRSIETPGEDIPALVQGLSIVHHQFMEALTSLGLEAVPGIGAPFDPKVHEALGLTPVFDSEQDGKVLHLHSPGFMVNGKVVQAAQVVVGKLQESAGEA